MSTIDISLLAADYRKVVRMISEETPPQQQTLVIAFIRNAEQVARFN